MQVESTQEVAPPLANTIQVQRAQPPPICQVGHLWKLIIAFSRDKLGLAPCIDSNKWQYLSSPQP